MIKITILIFGLALFSLIGWSEEASQEGAPPATEATKPQAKKTGPTNVLDFDGDVIEGERQAPNLFLQLQIDNPNLDILLYQRKDFNDFHALEKDRRPLFRKVTP